MKTVKSMLHGSECNLTSRYFYTSLVWIVFLVAFTSISAQNVNLETEKGLAEAVAPYDANVRQSILIACQYPSVLTQLRNSQDQTMESFQNMIGNFRQKKQEWFYTITRYPELLHQLAYLPANQNQEDVYKLLPSQEPALQQAALKLYKNEKKKLIKLDNISVKANNEFENSIGHLNANARQAFHTIQKKPDVLTLLTNNVDLTTKLGKRYKNDPVSVTNQLAVLHDKIEIQNQREAAAFKKQMESDPKAMRELRQASNAYGNNSYYNNPYYYPYSYWFGYPYWYSYPMWYPGMYWSYPGFSFGVGGLYGFPSYGFSYWFYSGAYYSYPHLYRALGTYYQSNVAVSRAITPVNHGFASMATSHYEPMRDRTSLHTTPTAYRQQSHLIQPIRSNYPGYFNSTFNRSPNIGFGRSGWNGGSMGGVHVGGGRGHH